MNTVSYIFDRGGGAKSTKRTQNVKLSQSAMNIMARTGAKSTWKMHKLQIRTDEK
jgi:hypothetical protein